MKPISLAALAALLLVPVLGHAAPNEPMTFHTASTGGNCVGCMWIAASGRIERDSADRFREYLDTGLYAPERGGTIHIDSTGGDVIGAIRLGEAIREHGGTVVISHTAGEPDERGFIQIDWDAQGEASCAGACILAFTGGKGRYALPGAPGNLVGFQPQGELRTGALGAEWGTEIDSVSGRNAMALAIDYLDAMGSSATLLSLLDEAGGTEPRPLTGDEIEEFSLDTLRAYDVELASRADGVAVVEVGFAREGREFHAELFCQDAHLMLRMRIDYAYSLTAESHAEWKFHRALQMNGINLATVELTVDDSHGETTRVDLLYRFEGASAAQMVDTTQFRFGSRLLSGRWAVVEHDAMAFDLPDDFTGMRVLPSACTVAAAGSSTPQAAAETAPTSTVAIAAGGSGFGLWRINRETSPIDDSPTFVMTLDAIEGRNSRGRAPTFIARCRSNTTEAYIVWGEYLGDDIRRTYSDAKFITTRIGSAPATTEIWGNSTDDDASFAPGWAGHLLKSMVKHDLFVAQVTPYRETPITAVFDLAGMDAGLRELSRTCNWSY